MGNSKDSRAVCEAFGSAVAVDFTALAKELLSGFFSNLAVLYLGRGHIADLFLVKF